MDVYNIYYSNKDKISEISRESIQFLKKKIPVLRLEYDVLKNNGMNIWNFDYFKCICHNYYLYPLNNVNDSITMYGGVDTNKMSALYVIPIQSDDIQKDLPYVHFNYGDIIIDNDLVVSVGYGIFQGETGTFNIMINDDVLQSIPTNNDVGYHKFSKRYKQQIFKYFIDNKNKVKIDIKFIFNSQYRQISINNIDIYTRETQDEYETDTNQETQSIV